MAFELSRIDRLNRTYSLATVLPGGIPSGVTGVAVALLPPRSGPSAATVWFAATYAAGSFTVLFAGPDADSSGALVVPASADLWVKVTASPQVDAARIERITVLGGGTVIAPGPLPQVLSVQGRTGAVVLAPADVGAATPADLSAGLATKVDSSTYTTGLAAKQDVATLGSTVTADATVRGAFGPLPKVAATVTASGTAVLNKHNPADATSGAITLTLPTGVAEGSQISVEKVDASANAVTLSGSLRGVAAQTVSLPWKNESLLLRADSTGSWWPVAGHKTKTSLEAALVPRTMVAATEADVIQAFNIVPATAGAAPWSLRYDSVSNGAGKGYNNGVWLGFNAERHSGGTATTGKSAIIMGFESNYWDPGGTPAPNFGPEWYIEYWSPDGTTTQMMRPFYARVLDGDNNASNNCVIHMDIGTDGKGALSVYAGLASQPLFVVNPTNVQSTLSFIVSGTQLSLKPPAGNPLLLMDGVGGTTPMLRYSIGGSPKFSFYAGDATTFIFNSSLSSVHMRFYAGATADAATTELKSTLQLDNTTVTTATAGAATALPATPQGYFQIKDAAGVVRKVPYYV